MIIVFKFLFLVILLIPNNYKIKLIVINKIFVKYK